MFAFVVFGLVSSVLAKRLAGKNVCEMTYFVSSGMDIKPLDTCHGQCRGQLRCGRRHAASLTVNIPRTKGELAKPASPGKKQLKPWLEYDM